MIEPVDKIPSDPLDPDRWVDQYGNYLYHFALGRLRSTTDSEMVVEETFLAALNSRDSYLKGSSERSWLISILKHKIIDRIRENYIKNPVTDTQKDEETVSQFFDRRDHFSKKLTPWTPDPAELLREKEFWRVFHKCSEKLPKTAGDAFLLREVEKMPSQEVCRVLGVTPPHLWALLYRARLCLRQCLEINWSGHERHGRSIDEPG
jgi:RNA polymerase sigma-70 factor (ECF subfamily)